MKPHEETWIVDPLTFGCIYCGDEQIFQPLGWPGRDLTIDAERAKLAAQAPAMARLLQRLVKELPPEASYDRMEALAILTDAGVLP